MTMDDDGDDKKFRMMPLGDIGTLVIALLFFVLFLILMFYPSFFGQFLMPAPGSQQTQQQSGEVSVTLPPKPKK